MNEIYKDLIYLLSCAVNGITPEASKVQAMDIENIYRLAKSHTVRAAVCIALDRAGIKDKQFHESHMKAIRKNIYLDVERKAITKTFEENKIWYMPLKGVILKEIYPETGMREMSDNDILYDASMQKKVKQIMLKKGYKAVSVGKAHHDEYTKPPVLNFELHTVLFGKHHAEPLYKYYADSKRLLCKDDDNNYGYHLSDEDFYVFMTAHEWKHYDNSGTGIRSLLDCYVYCRNKGDDLDWNYITDQCRQLKIDEFEYKRRQLALKVFSSDKLPELNGSETDMLLFYLTSGTYGTAKNFAEKDIAKAMAESKHKSKVLYILRCIFPKKEHMEVWFPFFYKHKLLLPIGYIWRWIRGISTRRRFIRAKLNVLKNYDTKKK